MSKELKRCPFCGGEAVKKIWKWDIVTIYVVGCPTCHVYFNAGDDEDEVIKQWNRRTANDSK